MSLAVVKEIIERRGAWYYFEDQKWQGVDAITASIREEIDLQERLTGLVLTTVDDPRGAVTSDT